MTILTIIATLTPGLINFWPRAFLAALWKKHE